MKKYKDVTKYWNEHKTKPGKVIDRYEIDVNGVVYKVDGHFVELDPSEREKEVANILINNFGGDIYLNPRIKYPPGLRIPDYEYRNMGFDLLGIYGNSQNNIYNAIHRKKTQASNFILDITMSPLSKIEIFKQLHLLYTSKHMAFLNTIIVIENSSILKVLKRYKKSTSPAQSGASGVLFYK